MTLDAPDFAQDAVDHAALRFLQEAWAAATSDFWRRRADQLEAARPVPGDYTGLATREQLSEQWQRLTAAAQACRHRGDFLDASRVEFHQTLGYVAHGAAA